MNMKKFEKFAIILLILWLLQRVIGLIAAQIYFRVFFDKLGDITICNMFSNYALMIFGQLVNILIGIWLFVTVKKEKYGTPWFWLMLGIFTGVLAALLYFILRIYQSIKPEHEMPTETLSRSNRFMKKVEIAALIILPFWLLHLFFSPVLDYIYCRILSPEAIPEFRDSTSRNLWINYSFLTVKQAYSILIGIWLFIITKKEKQGAPWFWLLLGIFGGVFAPLLYFILRIFQNTRPAMAIATENTES